MKTPRELLLERHRSMEPRLEAIRAAMRDRGGATPASGTRISVIEMVLSLRWHLAGISAVWLLLAVANRDAAAEPRIVAQHPSPPSAQRLAALRENRRQLGEFLREGVGSAEPAGAGPVSVPKRRSEGCPSILMA